MQVVCVFLSKFKYKIFIKKFYAVIQNEMIRARKQNPFAASGIFVFAQMITNDLKLKQNCFHIESLRAYLRGHS